jgi:hypothetical protein
MIMLNEIHRNWRKFVLIASLAVIASLVHAANMRPEEIIAKHLDSIGTPAARAAVKSRAVQGKLQFRILIGGSGESDGTWGRVSEGRKSNFVLKFGATGRSDWWGEQFVFDGDKASFAAPTSSHQWSVFAKFVLGQDFIVKESLLGGELSTGWALQNLDQGRIKFESLGRKKIDSREAECILYQSKGHTDMSIKLYFDPETYHHIMTTYSLESGAGVGTHGPTGSVFQQNIRYTIEERFSDFQTDNGITLPRHYNLQYTQELQSGSTLVYDWDMTVGRLVDNLGLDPANFRLK